MFAMLYQLISSYTVESSGYWFLKSIRCPNEECLWNFTSIMIPQLSMLSLAPGPSTALRMTIDHCHYHLTIVHLTNHHSHNHRLQRPPHHHKQSMRTLAITYIIVVMIQLSKCPSVKVSKWWYLSKWQLIRRACAEKLVAVRRKSKLGTWWWQQKWWWCQQ